METSDKKQLWQMIDFPGRPRTYSEPEELWTKAKQYFQWCDQNPWERNEQKKGNTIIPKGFEGDLSELSEVVAVELKRPYTYQGLNVFMGVGSEYFNQLENKLDEDNSEKDKIFKRIITHIRDIVRTQRFEGAMVGSFNPLIVSRLEGLSDKQEIKQHNVTQNIEVTAEEAAKIMKQQDNEV